MPRDEAAEVAEAIKRLSPPDRLRLAAGLLEEKRAALAYSIADGVVTELGAALALAKVRHG